MNLASCSWLNNKCLLYRPACHRICRSQLSSAVNLCRTQNVSSTTVCRPTARKLCDGVARVARAPCAMHMHISICFFFSMIVAGGRSDRRGLFTARRPQCHQFAVKTTECCCQRCMSLQTFRINRLCQNLTSWLFNCLAYIVRSTCWHAHN